MSNNMKKERFNNFWVTMFSFMVGYLIYFFVGNKLATDMVKNEELAGFVGIFFMSSCVTLIYIILNFMLERKLPKAFIYILWIHYFCLFFIVLFCLNIGKHGFVMNVFVRNQYKNYEFIFLVCRCVGLFFPIGYLARKEPFIKSIGFVVFFVLTIELSQYVFMMGNFDVNEIIFSILGVCAGYCTFYKKKTRRRKRRKATSHAPAILDQRPMQEQNLYT